MAEMESLKNSAINLSSKTVNHRQSEAFLSADSTVLVEMNGVSVHWGERTVLDSLFWKVLEGEHWLVRGPNGSGKTTLLGLINGDNPQAFSNDVRLFGCRRGSGESFGN